MYTVKEKDSVDFIKKKLLNNNNYIFVEQYEETIKKVRRTGVPSKTKGIPKSEEHKKKISAAMKGRSNFAGKKHSDSTKKIMAEKKYGNDHAKNSIWVHNPRGDEESRVFTLESIPQGYSRGRDYYSYEAGLYCFQEYQKTKKVW